MNAIVIKRKLLPSETEEISAFKKDEYKIFSAEDLPEKLKQKPALPYSIGDSTKKKLNYEIFGIVNDFGDKTIKGKTVSELLTSGKASIWHYHKFRIYFFVLNLFYEISEIKYYSENYEKVIYYSSNADLRLYTDLPANIEIRYEAVQREKRTNFASVLNYIILIKLKAIIGFFSCSGLDKKKHIIIDHSKRQTCIDLHTLREVKGNYNMQYLLDRADSDILVINEEVMPEFRTKKTFGFSVSQLFSKKDYSLYHGEGIMLRGLFCRGFMKKHNENKKFLLNCYKLIEKETGNEYEKVIFTYLKSLHNSSLFYLFRYFAYSRFFSKHNFGTLTTTDENSPVLKSIIDAAKANGILTIGMQHGNIHELHPAYIFTQNDRKNKVMTDYTFVWGKYYKDFLASKGNYPEESLITVGQIRTDIIPVLEKSGKSIGSDLIDTDKKVVLFASQPQRDAELRRRAAFDVFASVKDNPEILLIVKLHPGEINDVDYYESIAAEAGCRNYRIIYYYDLYLLLSRSDIVITCFSTVGSEAVYFHKPLVILDHLRQDIQNYHRNGVAFQALNAEELKDLIDEILKGKININQNAYEEFINNYAYRIDGNAAKRCIEFIKTISERD
jgi:hypothetical protein